MESGSFIRLLSKTFLGTTLGMIVTALGFATPAYAQLSVTDLTGGVTANDLAQSLAGSGVTISNVTFTGAQQAAGSFSGGNGIIGFSDGIILSSGSANAVIGPNSQSGVTTDFSGAGDADLDPLTGGFPTQDAAVLEFDFVPQGGSVSFLYVFSSDEYNEFVNSEFNDVFAFFVNGTNCALVGSDPVSINTINNGNPFGTGTTSHPDLYINNDLNDGGATIDTEMDGLTKVLTCTANVNSGATNHMKLAIADVSDGILDADVFIQAGSLSACDPGTQNCGGAPVPPSGTGGAQFEGSGCSLQTSPADFSSSYFGLILMLSTLIALGSIRAYSKN